MPDRVEQVTALPESLVYPVSDHLRVGLRIEPVSALEELRPNGGVILDDPVVDHRHFVAAKERVCVRLGRPAVRGPPGVGDAGAPVRPVPLDERSELRYLADRPHPVDAVLHHREPRRVVAAVLDTPQTLDEERNHVTLRGRPDDSTHDPVPPRCA